MKQDEITPPDGPYLIKNLLEKDIVRCPKCGRVIPDSFECFIPIWPKELR